MSKEQICTTCKKVNDAAPLSLIGECQGCYENATDQAWWDEVRKIEPTKPDAQEYADDYTFRGDTDYSPNEQEQMLITDALLGFECEMSDYVKTLQAEVERLKDSKCDLIAGLEKDKKLLLDQMAFLLTATMGEHLSKDDYDALVMDSIKIIEGMTYMPFTSYVHVIKAGG